MDKLIKKLSLYGNVEVIKEDFVFTLLMTKKDDGSTLTMNQVPFKIIELVTTFLQLRKPVIEVMKNEEDFLLLVLKK